MTNCGHAATCIPLNTRATTWQLSNHNRICRACDCKTVVAARTGEPINHNPVRPRIECNAQNGTKATRPTVITSLKELTNRAIGSTIVHVNIPGRPIAEGERQKHDNTGKNYARVITRATSIECIRSCDRCIELPPVFWGSMADHVCPSVSVALSDLRACNRSTKPISDSVNRR